LIVIGIDVAKQIGFKLSYVFDITVGRIWSSEEGEAVKEVGRGVGGLQGVAFFDMRCGMLVVMLVVWVRRDRGRETKKSNNERIWEEHFGIWRSKECERLDRH